MLLEPNEDGHYGLYGGETAYAPEVRFAQHKKGYKASRHVRRHGLHVLPTIAAHPTGLWAAAARDIEAALAARLRRAGYVVEGGH